MIGASHWLILVVFLLALGVGAYGLGRVHANNACAAQTLAAVERAIAQAEQLAREDAEILRADIERQERVRTRFRTITREVVRYVETHPDRRECLDADGLRVWNAANAGDFAPAAGGVRAGMPGAAAGSERQ